MLKAGAVSIAMSRTSPAIEGTVRGSLPGPAEMEVSAPDTKLLIKISRAKNNTTNKIKRMMWEVEMT